MAKRLTQSVKVGLFAVASAGAAIVAWRTVKKEIGGGDGYLVHAYVADATGLANHSRVTIAGIPVGTVEHVTLEGGRARIDVRVSNDVELYQSARLGVKSASLLGENVVFLSQGVGDPKKKDGDEIESLPPPQSFDALKDQMGRIADLVEKVVAQLARSVGSEEGGQNMELILKNLAQATDGINQTIRENRVVIKDTLEHIDRMSASSEPQVVKILENVRIITEDVKVLMAAQQGAPGAVGPDGQPAQPSGELRSTVERVNRASKNLESALEHIDSVAARVDRGEGTIGRLTKDEALINEVQGVAEGVNEYVDGLRRLQTIVGLRSDYNFLANTIKSYVELRLQPREDKYYLIELINDPRGKTAITQTDTDTTNPNEPAHYRTVTTTTTDAFRFSVQFARRLGPFTGRFGIKESTGGIGLDTRLLRNRFEINQDFFGFGEEIRPRYRVFLGYEFVSRFWLLGGVDHLFLGNRRDYFLGLQLRFTDDDLKTVLPFSGGVTSAGK